MDKIYLDNASTTFPKPECVSKQVYQYMTELGVNINRGCYNDAYDAEEMVYETRELLTELFHGDDCKNVVFTKNVTESLNVILKGFLKPGDHVIVSAMEHNAMMRPLRQLESRGVSFDRIPCNAYGEPDLTTLPSLLRPNTKAIAMTHASNVCGTVMPIREVGRFAHDHDLTFIVDCAQSAGVLPIHMREMHIDALAFTGHKGLLGPQGIGGFLLRDHMVTAIEPLLSGGTGSLSHTEEIPDFMPDRFEPGTMNLPGIAGLHASLLWLKETGILRICQHELDLTEYFLQGLKPLVDEGHIRIIGNPHCNRQNKMLREVDIPDPIHTVKTRTEPDRIGVVSIQTLTKELSQTAYELDAHYGIMTRVGLHCAPSAHMTLGTYPTGTIRFSFGWWNTRDHADKAISALKEIFHGI